MIYYKPKSQEEIDQILLLAKKCTHAISIAASPSTFDPRRSLELWLPGGADYECVLGYCVEDWLEKISVEVTRQQFESYIKLMAL
jgi:hypothetical protein